MTWVKLDDALFLNPKIGHASLEAIGVYTLSLTYAAHNLTDGRIPVTALHLLRCAETISTELVRIGLWESDDDAYRIHDYLKYNPSRRKVLRERQKTRERVTRHRTAVKRERNAVTTDAPVPVPEPLKDPPSTDVPEDSEVVFIRQVIARFNEAATDRNIEVDARLIERALKDHSHVAVADLKRVAFTCADWLAANAPRNGTKPRVAHLTLRKFMRDLPESNSKDDGW